MGEDITIEELEKEAREGDEFARYTLRSLRKEKAGKGRMKIYIVVPVSGGVAEGVKPFLDEKEAKQYAKEFRLRPDFNEQDNEVVIFKEHLSLPASRMRRGQKHIR